MMEFIPQCKGKDLSLVPPSRLILDGWFVMVKYDGNYVQIHKKGHQVKFYTSGGKEFLFPEIADYLINMNPEDFVIETEFIGVSSGMLGSRAECSTGTYRAEFSKGISRNYPGVRFMAFDIISKDGMPSDATFETRYAHLTQIDFPDNILPVPIMFQCDLLMAKEEAKSLVKNGWEGAYIKNKRHKQEPGKRVNTAIKLKFRPTADLMCIDIEPGTGKYEGMVGSLVLRDKNERVVRVGSGLSDHQRTLWDWVGKVIEIEYEQLMDTYIQPTFIRARDDKTERDAD